MVISLPKTAENSNGPAVEEALRAALANPRQLPDCIVDMFVAAICGNAEEREDHVHDLIMPLLLTHGRQKQLDAVAGDREVRA
ncbi:hypothetical protein [Ruegeria sp. HKCCA5763]|uniref:hypothetical protein n=1 Tax=Ruegeria sp. HKCCA5763 TaxID=2682987 RepID=UPI0014885C91|nr:hypothetical protein [Ruegeria sp. HKCCA5763]